VANPERFSNAWHDAIPSCVTGFIAGHCVHSKISAHCCLEMVQQRIALFGTSADPPTRGHQVLLEQLLHRYDRVATWASDNPMKQHGAPLSVRAMLLKALVGQLSSPNLELTQDLSSPFTMETLHRAHQRWPQHTLVFVVGSDLAAQIPHWKQADQWLSQCQMAIAPRQGWPLTSMALTDLSRYGASVEVLDVEIPASASSEQRRAPQPEQVPGAVWPLLLEHNLYGLNPTPC
jgi:nicotinate-nucleotide adenylyltransferase